MARTTIARGPGPSQGAARPRSRACPADASRARAPAARRRRRRDGPPARASALIGSSTAIQVPWAAAASERRLMRQEVLRPLGRPDHAGTPTRARSHRANTRWRSQSRRRPITASDRDHDVERQRRTCPGRGTAPSPSARRAAASVGQPVVADGLAARRSPSGRSATTPRPADRVRPQVRIGERRTRRTAATIQAPAGASQRRAAAGDSSPASAPAVCQGHRPAQSARIARPTIPYRYFEAQARPNATAETASQASRPARRPPEGARHAASRPARR